MPRRASEVRKTAGSTDGTEPGARKKENSERIRMERKREFLLTHDLTAVHSGLSHEESSEFCKSSPNRSVP
jgi:hypothetical protein